MTSNCKLCGQVIHFNDKIVSEKTGKKIPLNEGSDERHKCKQWKELNRRYYKCNNCQADIYFDDDFKTDNGKYIPLNKVNGEPHECDDNSCKK
jgi:hypothetical protein